MARIARVDIGRVDYPLVGEFKFFRNAVRPTIVLRLTDENGIEGWGQSVPIETWTYETIESVETTLRHYLAPVILGADPSDIAGHSCANGARDPAFFFCRPAAVQGRGRSRLLRPLGQADAAFGRRSSGRRQKNRSEAELDHPVADH